MWIKSEYFFGDRCAILTMTSREAAVNGLPKVLECDDPARIEQAILDLIRCQRPELTGCMLVCMSHDPRRMQWLFTVTHESLPKRQQWEMPVEMPLIVAQVAHLTSEECWKVSPQVYEDDIIEEPEIRSNSES